MRQSCFQNELATQSDATVSVLKSLSVSTGWVGVAGLGGFIALIAILIGNHADPTVIAILALLFAATAFGICFLLTRQISRLTEISLMSNQKSEPEQLNPAITGQIESPREPFISVTENTTRTLDEVLAKRN